MMDRNYLAPPAGAPPPVFIPTARNQGALKIVLAVMAAMVPVVLGLIVLLLIGIETGPVALLVGMICACLPVPLYVMLLLWIDRYEAEPPWMLATAFFWGALVAVFIAFVLNTADEIIVAVLTNANVAEKFGPVISAPLVEDSAKATILFVFFFFKKDEFDDIIRRIFYAGMVGLGFAMSENIQYYGKALQGRNLPFLLILRGMIAPFSHPLFTSMTGIGLGWSRQSDNGFIMITMPALGFMLAIIMHATWNGSATYGGGAGFIPADFLIIGPAVLLPLITIFFS